MGDRPTCRVAEEGRKEGHGSSLVTSELVLVQMMLRYESCLIICASHFNSDTLASQRKERDKQRRPEQTK